MLQKYATSEEGDQFYIPICSRSEDKLPQHEFLDSIKMNLLRLISTKAVSPANDWTTRK